MDTSCKYDEIKYNKEKCQPFFLDYDVWYDSMIEIREM